MLQKPYYDIVRVEPTSALSRQQLRKVLQCIPLVVEVRQGHELSLEARTHVDTEEDHPTEPVLRVYHGAYLNEIKPGAGKRLSSACFLGEDAKLFTPSRVMDERTGGGACSSYHFSTSDLGISYYAKLGLDIYKLG